MDSKYILNVDQNDIDDQELLLELLLEEEGIIAPALQPIKAQQRGAEAPLSFAQQRLWFLDQIEPGNPFYNLSSASRLIGQLDVYALEQSLNAMVARHETLRTSIHTQNGTPLQRISSQVTFPLRTIDLQHLSETSQQCRIQDILSEQARHIFDLTSPPLIRASLLRLNEHHHIFVFTSHHIISDGWSSGIFLRELVTLYEAFVERKPSPLPELAIQYADFAIWQRDYLQGDILKQQIDYWKGHLAAAPALLELPYDRNRPPQQSYQGQRYVFSIPNTLVSGLNKLSQQHDVTLFMTLLSAFNVLLHRYTNENDIVVGSPIANRNRREIEGLIGFFINTLVLRTSMAGNPSFAELLKRVREVTLGAYAHQDLPFEKLVEIIQPSRNLSYHPLFQVMLILHNAARPVLENEHLSMYPLDIYTGTAQFDLTIFFVENSEGLTGAIEYSTDLFDNQSITRFIEHFLLILSSVVEKPDQKIAAITFLTAEEQNLLLRDWQTQPSPSSLADKAYIHDLFAAQARRTPTARALVFEQTMLTYAELHQQVEQFAAYLRQQGIGAEALVGVYMERSVELVIGLLAILHAGGAYVPLDPGYPTERLAFMIEDAGMSVILTQQSLLEDLPATEAQLICLDNLPKITASQDMQPVSLAPDNIAYMIYTSGSTGRPKGVMVSHHNLTNFLLAMDKEFSSEQAGTWLAVTSISFDISILELFWTLCNGYQVILQSEQDKIGYFSLENTVDEHTAKNIDFSLFYFASNDNVSQAETYQLLIESARYADEHGFSAVWTPERHFHAFGGLYPNPSVMGAALATITSRIAIRAGSVVLPLHNPVRVAEEWSLVDNLSNGRVGVSFASGWHAHDFVLAPDNYHQRKNIMLQGIETIRQLWRGESISLIGGTGKETSISIMPHPVQSELPIWITAAGNPETFRIAGEIGANLLTHLLGQDLEELKAKIAIYRQALRDHGHTAETGKVTLMLHTFVGEDLETVREKVRQPMCQYLRSSFDLLANLAQEFGKSVNAEDFTLQDLDDLVEFAFERYFQTSGLFGTLAMCQARVKQLKAIDVDEIACLIDFGVDHASVMQSLDLLNQVRSASNQPQQNSQPDYSLPAQIIRHNVTHLQCTPSLATILVSDPSARQALGRLKQLLLGGEALPASLVAELNNVVHSEIHNMYGPTETTIWSTTTPIAANTAQIHIGYPIRNTRLYILDASLQPVPIGVPGELHIGGAGVTRGYFHHPELVAEKYIPDHLSAEAGTRLYKTGDLVRYRHNGNIEYLNRIDQQVKLHGYRIELKEIETVLCQYPGIRESALIIREDIPDDKRLVAYFTLDKTVTISPHSHAIYAFLKERLPIYMLPSALVHLEALPLTPNGKLNRRALPAPGSGRIDTASAYIEASTPLEEMLVAIWQQVLRVEKIGITDNFFQLGGDSILTIQLVSRLNQAGLHVTAKQVFQYQTIAELSTVITPSHKIEAEQGPATGEIRFTPIQHWFFAQHLPVPQHYNQSLLLELRQQFEAALLHKAFEHLLQHHDALRLRFWQEETTWHAAYTDINNSERSNDLFTHLDLSGLAEAEQQALIEVENNRLQASLSLQEGKLIRAIHFKRGNIAADRLFIVIHHLVIDGISWRILLEDLYRAYQQLSQEQLVLLPAKTTSFQKWNLLLHTYAQSERLRSEAHDYWLREFQQEIEEVPQNYPDGHNLESSACNHWILLSKEETHALLYEVPHAYHTQIDEVLLTALTQAYTEWSGQTRLLLDLEGHGREAIIKGADIGHTIGWFTSLFPVVLALPEDNDPGTILKAIKEHLRAIPHQGIGYGLLRYLAEDLVIKEQMASLPQAQIIFNYLGQFDQGLPGQATSPFTLVHRAEGKTHDPTATRAYLLDINGAIHDGQLEMSWTYSQDIFAQATIAKLADLFSQRLRALIKHCQSHEASGYSPTDFPLLKIEQRQLDSLIEQAIGSKQWQAHERKQLINQIEDIYPLSPLQMGILFHHLYAPEAGIYFQQLGYVMEGELNISAFVQSWRGVLERHPVLRSAFYWQELDNPLQIVYRSAELPIEQLDWQGISQAEQSTKLAAYLKADQLRGFQFEQAPLIRITIIRCATNLYHCIWSYSHLILDGWCLPIILKEVFQSYKAQLTGVPAVIPRHRPYRDYIAWLQEQDYTKAEAFWRQTLKGYPVPSPLALDEHASTATDEAERVTGYTHEEHISKLTVEASASLDHFTRTHQFTLNTLIAGAWAILLSSYNGVHDLVFGMVHAGRSCDLGGIESMIGLFINTLPARIQITPDVPLLTWLQELQAQFLEARQYEHTPLSHIINWSEVPRNLALFETLLVFENYPVEKEHEGLLTILESYFFERTNYPLTILVTPGKELRLKLSYDPARFSSSSCKQLLERLQALIEHMATTDAQARLADYIVPSARVALTQPSLPLPIQGAKHATTEAEEAKRSNGASKIAATNATEALLINIWEQVLHVKGIGVQDNFFALGGDSLMSMQIVDKANQAGLPLTLRQLIKEQTIANVAAKLAREKLKQTEQPTPHKIEQSSAREQQSVDQTEEASQLSTAGESMSASETGSMPQLTPDRTHINLPFPLTDVQHAYWMGRNGIFELGNVATHIYIEVESTSLDIARFNLAWQHLIERHDMLRSIILADGRQQILEQVEAYPIIISDFRGWDRDSTSQALESIRQFMSHQILPTDQWPLFEIRASQLDQQRTRLHLSIDYLIVDAWSLQILFRELVQLYHAPTEELIPLTISFRDYVLALKEANIYKRAEEYWWKRLEDLPPAPELSLTKSPSTIAHPKFVRWGGRLDSATWQRLKHRAGHNGITPSSILLAAFAEILSVWSKSPRFTINLTLFNRLPVHPQINNIVGDFTSLTLLAVDNTQSTPYDPNDSFKERALRIQQQLWEDLDHRNMSGVRVLREWARRQGRAQQASMPIVFTSTIGMSSSAETTALLNEMFEEVYSIGQTPQVWLDYQVSEQAGGLRFSWDAVEELFPEGYIQAMFQAYIDLLQYLADENQSWPTFSDEIIPVEQLEQRASINATTTPLPEQLLLHSLFEHQTREQPEQIAIISAHRTLTYSQVYNRARYLSYQLQERTTVLPNTLVGIVMEKGWEQVVAALGILQSGAAYVPIDAGLPAERIAFFLEHGNVQIVLTQSWINEKVSWPADITRICVDLAGEIDGSCEDYHSLPRQQPHDLAYVIYTSGSTGLPKGVMIDHLGALNTILDLNQRFHIGPQDRVLAISSLSFDLSVYDIFGLLAAGGSLVLPEVTASRDPERWLTLVNQHNVTIWNTVPTLLQMLVDATNNPANIVLPTLRLALLSGDWIPVTLPDRFRQLTTQAEVFSLGGATEASIWSILYPITEVAPGQTSIPYGKPMLNQTFHVLNQNLRPCPIWVPGNLYIGGIGLALGYWRDEEKTRHQFIQHPLTGERLYSTGDLGRYLPDGNIEFLGREDFQVKIRGHRIELGEIEATLNQHPDVRASVVLALGEKQGPKRLVSYIVAENESSLVLPNNDLLLLNPPAWEKLVAAGTIQSQLELAEIDPQLAKIDMQHFLSIGQQLSNFVDRFVNVYIYLALRKLGIFTQANERHTITELVERYAILPRYSKWLYRCLLMLVNEGLLRIDDQVFYNIAPLPAQDVDALWSEIKNELPDVDLDFLRGQLDAFRLNGERLVSVLTGDIHAVEFLFPEGDPSQAEHMYQTTFHHCNSIISSILAEVIETLPADRHLRILEIGAGVGGTTASVLPILPAQRTTYVYTDISRYFMPIGKRNFGNYPFVEYNVLDIEKDPQSQGYEAGSFDIILAASVLHATRDIQETLQHVRSLLKSNGLLLMVEETHFHHMFNLSMGLQQGFDHFEDIHVRPLHPLLSAQQWQQLILAQGFNSFAIFNKPGSLSAFLGLEVILAQASPTTQVHNLKSVLNDFLKEKLPDYMIPSNMIILPALPLTANGKVDHQKLKALAQTEQPIEKKAYIAPHNEIEKNVVELWQQLLDLDQISMDENFFALGGDSLIATRLITQLRETLQVEIPIRSLFEAPTVTELAKKIDQLRQGTSSLDKPTFHPIIPREALLPLSFAQQRLWFLDQLMPNSHFYNIPIGVHLTGVLDHTALEKSLQHLIQRHETLRTTFTQADQRPVQQIAETLEICIPIIDMTTLRVAEEKQEQVQMLGREEARRPFDLFHGPLLRFQLLRLAEYDHVLLTTMHHIVSDGWSMGVLIQELTTLYKGFASNRPVRLPALPIQYADFASIERAWFQGQVLEKYVNYWQQHLAGAPSLLQLPTDHSRPETQSYRGAILTHTLPQALVNHLELHCRQQELTLFMILLAAFNVLLRYYSEQEKIVVGTDVANRPYKETEHLIGFFVNQLVLFIDFSGITTFAELLDQVREVTLGAYEHQELPFNKLVEILNPERTLQYEPLFQVKLVLQNVPAPNVKVTGLSINPFEIERGTTQLDLHIRAEERPAGFTLTAEYSTDLFEEATIARWLRHFEMLLKVTGDTPRIEIAALNALLVQADRQEQMKNWPDKKDLNQRDLKTARRRRVGKQEHAIQQDDDQYE